MYTTHHPAPKKPISLWLHHPITVTDMLVIASIMLLLQTWQQPLALLLNQNLSYRWLSAHFVHVNWQHWLLNAVALLLLPMLFSIFSRRVFFLLLGWLSVSTSFCLLYFDQLTTYHVTAYVGLSGVLHGLYFYAALVVLAKSKLFTRLFKKMTCIGVPLPRKPPSKKIPCDRINIHAWDIIQSLILAIGIMGKVVTEQLHPHSMSQMWLQAPVVYTAHADGVVLAITFGLGQLIVYSIGFYYLNHN